MKKIESLDEWYALASELAEDGYTPYIRQYRYYEPEGFHAIFWRKEGPLIEIETHSEEVQNEVVRFTGK